MTSTSPRIVITGVASGIGKETAQLMSSQGYEIIGVDRAPVEDFVGTFLQGDQTQRVSTQLPNRSRRLHQRASTDWPTLLVSPALPPQRWC